MTGRALAGAWVAVAVVAAIGAELCSANRRGECVATKPVASAGRGVLPFATTVEGGTNAKDQTTEDYGGQVRTDRDAARAVGSPVDDDHGTREASERSDARTASADRGLVAISALDESSDDRRGDARDLLGARPGAQTETRIEAANRETALLQAEANARYRPVDPLAWWWRRAEGDTVWWFYSGTKKTDVKALPCTHARVKLALTTPIERTISANGEIVFSGPRTGFPNVFCVAVDGTLQRRNADDADYSLIAILATHEWIERGR